MAPSTLRLLKASRKILANPRHAASVARERWLSHDKNFASTSARGFPKRCAVVFIASPASASNTALASLRQNLRLPVVTAKSEIAFGHNHISDNYRKVRRRHIFYQHLFPTPRNVEIIARARFGPCLLSYRNAYDWVVSVAEKVIRVKRGWIGIDSDYLLVRDDTLPCVLDYVITFELPWMVRLLCGWLEAAEAQRIDLEVCEFGELIDGSGLARFVARLPQPFVMRPTNGATIPVANLNVGRAGRGMETLSAHQLEAVDHLVARIPARFLEQLPLLLHRNS